MDLRRGEPDAVRILHGLHHVGDQAADLARRRVGDRLGLAEQYRMAHAGDLQERHASTIVGSLDQVNRYRMLARPAAALG